MRYYEDGYYRNDWCNWCDRGDYCSSNKCHDYKPEPLRGNSAQFINTEVQDINVRETVPVKFNCTQVNGSRGITLQPPNNIILGRGRYLVSYYVTIQNNDDDADTYNARLRLEDKDLVYTTSKVRLNPRIAPLNIDFIGNLSKTNLIEVTNTTNLQLVISVTDPTGTPDANYQIQDASIVIERLN